MRQTSARKIAVLCSFQIFFVSPNCQRPPHPLVLHAWGARRRSLCLDIYEANQRGKNCSILQFSNIFCITRLPTATHPIVAHARGRSSPLLSLDIYEANQHDKKCRTLQFSNIFCITRLPTTHYIVAHA